MRGPSREDPVVTDGTDGPVIADAYQGCGIGALLRGPPGHPRIRLSRRTLSRPAFGVIIVRAWLV